MTDLWDDSRSWISLHVATTWLIDLRQVRTLAASGTLELGRDPANGLFLNRNSLERCIVPLSPTEATARLDSWVSRDASALLTITEAAARAHVAAKTLRLAILHGELIARRKGVGVKSPYLISAADLQAWMAKRSIDDRDVLSVLTS